MAKEIERKYLVADNGWRSEIASTSVFLQAYLAAVDDRSLRVRLIDNERAVLTIKIGRELLCREEFEYEIPVLDAKELIQNALGIVLEKTRHKVEHKGFTWEIDVYTGTYAGLVVAEVELEHQNQHPPLPAEHQLIHNGHLHRLM